MNERLRSRRIVVALLFPFLLVGCGAEPNESGLCTLPGLAYEEVATRAWALHVGDSLVIIRGDERRAVSGARGLETFGWSADGRGLVFTRGDSLYRVVDPGSEPIALSGDWTQVRFPASSPDGSSVAISINHSYDPGEGWELALLRLDDGTVTSLGHGYDASWSPDGSTLYYEVHTPSLELMRRDMSSGRTESLGLESVRDRTVEVSPTGEALAFTRGRGALMLHRLDQGETLALTSDLPHDRFASFSPDGSLVLFYRQDESDGVELSIIACEVVTGRTTVLETGSVWGAAFAPSW